MIHYIGKQWDRIILSSAYLNKELTFRTVIQGSIYMLLPPLFFTGILIPFLRYIRKVRKNYGLAPIYIKVKIKDIECLQLCDTKCNVNTNYRWDELEESIRKYGLIKTPEILKRTEVYNNKLYYMRNGNHRIHILKEMYGEDHKITVKIVTELHNYASEVNALFTQGTTPYDIDKDN